MPRWHPWPFAMRRLPSAAQAPVRGFNESSTRQLAPYQTTFSHEGHEGNDEEHTP
jgi:hypothetical protein